jgi:hypothetical protein
VVEVLTTSWWQRNPKPQSASPSHTCALAGVAANNVAKTAAVPINGARTAPTPNFVFSHMFVFLF